MTGDTCYTVAQLTDDGNLVAVEDSKQKRNKTALLFLKWDLFLFQQRVRELFKGQNPKKLSSEALSELIADLGIPGNHVLVEVPGKQLYHVYHRLDPKRRLSFNIEEVRVLLDDFMGDTYDKHTKGAGAADTDYPATFSGELDYLLEHWGEIKNPQECEDLFRQINSGEFKLLTLTV